jgi:hypothetical protein
MIDRTGPSIIAAYQRNITFLESRGFKPLLQRLNNEATSALQEFLSGSDIDFQLTPPHVHHRNAAERAIRTFKNHFIAGLCSMNPNFPFNLWDKLIPQCLITLNLLRRSRITPQLSSQSQINGAFHFNRTPLAPPGTKVIIHEKPSTRGTWAPHAVEGWYIGPAQRHYRCYRVWAWVINSERISDTLTWFPTTIIMPRHSSTNIAIAAAHDLARALLSPPPSSPLSPIYDSQRHQLLQLSSIFLQHTSRTDNILPPPTLPMITTSIPSQPIASSPAPIPSHSPHPSPNNFTTTQVSLPRMAPDTTSTQKRITWAPSVTGGIAPIATYKSATINPGQRRRRAMSAQKNAADRVAFLSASITIHPGIKSHTWCKRRSASQGLHRSWVQQPLPATHINHAQRHAPHVTITLHIASFTTQIATTANALQSAHTVIDAVIGESYKHAQLIRGPNAGEWLYSTANEFGHLTKCVAPRMPSGSETMRYLFHHQLLPGRQATYARFITIERPHKAETKRVRLTVGGNLVHYPDKVSTPIADLSTVKLLLNSVISTPGARFATLDLKDFYLGTPMARKEYMRIPLASIPQSIIDEYALHDKAHKCLLLVEICKGMYGLLQAGILAFNQLKTHIATHGYAPCTHTPGLWTHSTRDITFSLVVNDFGIKYTNRDVTIHLLTALEKMYTVTTDWTGSLYLAMTLNWDYIHSTVDISMPGYVAKALERFQHTPTTRAEHSPHAWSKPVYGTHPQLTSPVDDTALLPPAALTRIQEITGTLLLYARAIDCTMLFALGKIALNQAKGTYATAQALTQLLNYASTHPDATVRYTDSDMYLHIHSDASYAGGTFFLSSRPPDPTATPSPTATPPPYNGAIHTISSIMRNVMASATEAELGAVFQNARDCVPLRIALEEMGHPQAATPIQTDNTCAAGIANKTVKQHRSKAIDIRFYWIRDRIKQVQFIINWRAGKDNLADYFTKHHSPAHHKLMCSHYLLEVHKPAPT